MEYKDCMYEGILKDRNLSQEMQICIKYDCDFPWHSKIYSYVHGTVRVRPLLKYTHVI